MLYNHLKVVIVSTPFFRTTTSTWDLLDGQCRCCGSTTMPPIKRVEKERRRWHELELIAMRGLMIDVGCGSSRRWRCSTSPPSNHPDIAIAVRRWFSVHSAMSVISSTLGVWKNESIPERALLAFTSGSDSSASRRDCNKCLNRRSSVILVNEPKVWRIGKPVADEESHHVENLEDNRWLRPVRRFMVRGMR